jgi:hypothetical protein
MSGMRRAIVLTVLAGELLLAGCGDPPPEAPVAPAGNSSKTPKVAGLPPEMVAAVPAGRSSGVVSVHFALGKTPIVGQAFPVDIAIVPHLEFNSVRAHFDGVDGLAVTTGNAMEPVADVKEESVVKHQLVLLPAKEGVYMISATLETESPVEGTVSRVFSLPMVVSGRESQEPAPAAASPPAPAPQ